MLDRVKDFIIEHNLINKTIIVGFSGGYDSMCLLDILYKIKQEAAFYDINVIAAHFNHNWRGEESDKEQEVCRLFAASRGFEFFTKTAPKWIKKTENDARNARYDFFEEAAENYDTDVIFTAHNKDDNAETILYRVIKGTGIVGLKGIAQKRDIYYRPLLKTTRAEILKYCNNNNLSPNEDSSNLNTEYKRNLLRLTIIPQLEEINSSVKDSLNTLAEVANNENSIIEEYLTIIKQNIIEDNRIITKKYKELSTPVKMRIIHEYIQHIVTEYDYKKIKEIYNFIELNMDKRNGSTISLATAKWLYVDETSIEMIPYHSQVLAKENEELSINTEGEYKFNNKTIVVRPYKKDEIIAFPESTANFAYVDLSKIKFPFIVRNRRDGDMINPFGMNGTMKLKKYLNSKGVSRHTRDDLILFSKDNNDILWVVGVGLSNKIGVTSKPSHVIEVK